MTQDQPSSSLAPQLLYFQPNVLLRLYIECYWMLTAPQQLNVEPQRMPADSRVELIFSFASGMRRTAVDAFNESDACLVETNHYVLGTRQQPYMFAPTGPVRYVAVRFKPSGLSAFTLVSLTDLEDICLDAEHLWSRASLQALLNQLAVAPTSEQISILDQALISRLNPPQHTDRILHCITQLSRIPTGVRIADLATDVNLSQKHLERLFVRYVGFSPSMYARIARFQRVLKSQSERSHIRTLSEVAIAAGYYDQAHFNRDFKLFSGTSPAKFLTEANSFAMS